jgi:myo-inositol-1(or 4)-monophosphatase
VSSRVTSGNLRCRVVAYLDTSALLTLASQVARQARSLVMEARGHPVEVDTKSTITDMVTETDRASERFITASLLGARPDDAILGEEGASATGTSGVEWVVDPIDGTTNYLYGAHGFAISIAATYNGETVVAVVHDCVLDEQFTARLGAGASLDGAPIHCNEIADLAVALVGTGFAYQPARRVRQAAVLTQVIGSVRDVRRRGSAALDLCWVGCGRLDAYYELGLGRWDVAAGELIAREAGAITEPLADGLEEISVLAAPPMLVDALRALLLGAGAASV